MVAKQKRLKYRLYWHIHHEKLAETNKRIDFLDKKESDAFNSVREYLIGSGARTLERLHSKEHKNCPWNGYTIFPLDAE